MCILQARDIRCILVRATHDAEIAIGRRSTTENDTLLVTAHDSKIPMLADGDAANGRLEFFERAEALAHQEPRTYLGHSCLVDQSVDQLI